MDVALKIAACCGFLVILEHNEGYLLNVNTEMNPGAGVVLQYEPTFAAERLPFTLVLPSDSLLQLEVINRV